MLARDAVTRTPPRLNTPDTAADAVDPAALLAALARVGTLLLEHDGDDFDAVIAEALGLVAGAAGMHRAALIEHLDDGGQPGAVWWRVAYEWHAPEAVRQSATRHAGGRIADSPAWSGRLFAGECVLAARTEDLADPGLRAVQAAIGARYLLSAGIWIEGGCWGALSLDDGVTARERTEGERQALAAAAQLFGLAVHRRRERRRREAMLVRRDALLAGVAHAAEILTRTPDLPQALVKATRMLGEAAGVDRVNVFRYDHDGQAGFLYAEWARAGVAATSQIYPGPYGYAEYAEMWRPLLAGDVYHSSLREKTGANAALNAALNTKTDLFVPVCVEGRFWGMLNFDDCTTERAWTGGEIDVLRTAAAAVAAAVRREGLERERAQAAEVRAAELERRNALLATAVNASRALIDAADFGAACDRVLATLGPALDADRAALGVLAPSADGGAPWCELTHEWTAPGVARQTDDPALRRTRLAGSDAHVAAFLAGEPFQATFDALPAPQRREQAAAGAQAGFALPVLVDGRAWGVLGFDDCRRARVWDAEEIGFVRIVTTALAAAVQRQRAERDRAEAVARERERAAEERAAEAEHLSGLLRGVVAASRVLIDEPEFEMGLRRWCGRLGTAVAAQRVGIGVFAPDPSHTVPRAIMQVDWAATEIASLDGTRVPHTADFDAWSERLLAGEAIWAVYAELVDPASRAYWDATGCHANLIVPVLVDHRVWGYVYFDLGEDRPYRAADLAVLQAAADGLAAVIKREEALRAAAAEREAREGGERAHLAAVARERERAAEERAAALALANAALRDREALLAAAAEASRLLLESGDFWGTLPRALARIGQVAGWDRTQLLLSRSDAAGRPGHAVVAEWVAEGVRAQLGDATHEWVADADVPELAAEVRSGCAFWITLDEMAAPTRTTFGGMDIQTTVAVPVFVDGAYAGVVGFDDCARRRPRQAHELDALETAARVVAAAIQRERLVDEVARERERAAEERAAALAAVNADLRLRDRLLTAVTESLRLLNADSSDDFDATVREALRLVGEAAAMHRVRVFLQRVDAVSGRARHDLTYEWWAPGFASRASDGLPGFADGDLAAYLAPLMAGRSLWQLPGEVPDPLGASSARVGMRSMGCVPVFVGAEYAGIVTFDDCVERRAWSQAEQDALDIAACAIGAAIHRREMEQAARTRAAELGRSNAVLSTRQRMLEAAVETSDALLAAVDVEEAIGGVLARLGAVLDADRALLIRFDPPTAHSVLGWAVVEHEWTAPGVLRQSSDPALTRMNVDGYGDLAERLRVERVVQFVTDDLPAESQAEQQATGAVSQVVITVVVDGAVWGFLGFDDCRRPRVWDAGEVGLLQVVAAALGSAIKREGLLHDRMVVERAATEERTRIAREMHDTLAQGLAGIVMQLGAARAKLGAAGAAAGSQLDRVEGLARESLAVARRSITVLRPHAPEIGEGLAAALGTAAMAARAECPAVVALGVTGAARRAPPEVEFELLRVAQAALANAAQHAHAARIAVTLDFGAGDAPALRIAVSDDGRGFDPAASRPGRFGLVGMLERAARVGAALTLVTAPGEGTEVVVVWPGGSGDAGRPAVPSTSSQRGPASVDALAGARADAPT